MEQERSETEEADETADETKEAHERLALPLLVPAIAFLFAILVIYGLSRIYLDLSTFKFGDVTMATPLAVGVAIAILAVSAYLANRPSVPPWQFASIAGLAIVLLTGGAIWAAVYDEGEPEHGAPQPTVTDGVEPPAGAVTVSLAEFNVVPGQDSTSAGTVTFSVSNDGSIQHNLRVIKTDLSPDDLPVNEERFMADEDLVDVVAASENLDAGASENVTVDLESGSYALICNIPSHYDSGMRTAFTIE